MGAGKKSGNVRDVALMGMMTATLEVSKLALAGIPNVEIISLLVILYSLSFGRKTIYSVCIFVLLECMIWGFGLWTIMYLYAWPLLSIGACALRNIDSLWFWSILSAAFGLMFGGLCALVYLFLGGPKTAFAWWIAGIPFDLVHGVSNFVLMAVLYRPLRRVLHRLSGE